MTTIKKSQERLDSDLIEAVRDQYRNRKNEIEELLVAGANPNATFKHIGDDTKETPLYFASKYCKLDIARLLLERGANPNIQNLEGSYPLLEATQKAVSDLFPSRTIDLCFPIINLLLQNGADPNLKDKDGLTPIFVACSYPFLNIISLFLENGADPNIQNNLGETPLYRICQSYSWNYPNSYSYANAKASFDLLLKAGADINATAKNGWTPLHRVCYTNYTVYTYNSHDNLVTLFLEAGADPNAQDLEGNTPLHLEAQAIIDIEGGYSSQLKSIEALFKHGANPFLKNAAGQKPSDLVSDDDKTKIKTKNLLLLLEDMYLKKQSAKGLRFLNTILQQPNLQKEPLPDLGENIIRTLGKNYLGLTPANVEWEQGMPASLIQQLKEAKSAKESRMAAAQDNLRTRLRREKLEREKEAFLEGLNDEERRAAGNLGWLGGKRFQKKTRRSKKSVRRTHRRK